MNWQPDWTGQTCCILGGGPSLRGFAADRLRGRRVIGINEAGLTLVPWCDVLMWADQRWLDWNKDRLHLHTGALKVCMGAFFSAWRTSPVKIADSAAL